MNLAYTCGGGRGERCARVSESARGSVTKGSSMPPSTCTKYQYVHYVCIDINAYNKIVEVVCATPNTLARTLHSCVCSTYTQGALAQSVQ